MSRASSRMVDGTTEYTRSGMLGLVQTGEVSGELSGRRSDATLSLAEVAMYVPLLVLRQFMDARHVPLPYEERVRGALLFADVSGFTKLTQALQASSLGLARGAEVLNDILSNYFNVLIECFHEHGGDVVSFSGDAMTVLFEVRDRDRDDRALRGKG